MKLLDQILKRLLLNLKNNGSEILLINQMENDLQLHRLIHINGSKKLYIK